MLITPATVRTVEPGTQLYLSQNERPLDAFPIGIITDTKDGILEIHSPYRANQVMRLAYFGGSNGHPDGWHALLSHDPVSGRPYFNSIEVPISLETRW